MVQRRRLLAAAGVALALYAISASGSPGPDDPPRGPAPDDPAEPAPAKTRLPTEERTAAEPVPAAFRRSVAAEPPPGHLPANLLQLPSGVDAALVIGLESNRLHVFSPRVRGSQPPESRAAGSPTETPLDRRSLYVAIGKNGGAKRRQGDEKTPVGVYFVTSFLPAESLPAIYGAGAYPINYPNTWDRRLGRTGNGIWIHGTDKETAELAPQSSRGCLTLADADFLSLERVVEYRRTPVVISDRLSWAPAAEIEARRQKIAAVVEAWRRDWESLDTDAYLAHYSATFRTEGMSRERWVAHKRRVNAQKTFIRLRLDRIGIYGYPGEPDAVLVTFDQDYRSNNYNKRSFKQQLWRLEEEGWRIVHEGGW